MMYHIFTLFLHKYYGTKWPLCADVPLRNHSSYFHALSQLIDAHTSEYHSARDNDDGEDDGYDDDDAGCDDDDGYDNDAGNDNDDGDRDDDDAW